MGLGKGKCFGDDCLELVRSKPKAIRCWEGYERVEYLKILEKSRRDPKREPEVHANDHDIFSHQFHEPLLIVNMISPIPSSESLSRCLHQPNPSHQPIIQPQLLIINSISINNIIKSPI